MTLIKWTPMWDPFEDMDRMMPSLRQVSGFVPSLDIYQDKDNVIIEAPLASVNPEDVKISIENDVLTIQGDSETKSEVDEKDYYRKEVKYGSFHRSVALPVTVKGDKAKAEYDDGILKITIPKEEKVKPKTVKIEVKKKDAKAQKASKGKSVKN